MVDYLRWPELPLVDHESTRMSWQPMTSLDIWVALPVTTAEGSGQAPPEVDGGSNLNVDRPARRDSSSNGKGAWLRQQAARQRDPGCLLGTSCRRLPVATQGKDLDGAQGHQNSDPPAMDGGCMVSWRRKWCSPLALLFFLSVPAICQDSTSGSNLASGKARVSKCSNTSPRPCSRVDVSQSSATLR